MTTKPAYSQFIGKHALYALNGLDVPVVILNHRYMFGRDDLEIQAVGGKLKKWVSADSVLINTETLSQH